MGKSKLASAADLTLLWDSRRLFDLPAAGSGLNDADGDDEGVREPEAEGGGGGKASLEEEEEGEEEGDELKWAVGGEVQESGALAVRGGFAAAWTRTVGWSAGRRSGASGAGTGRDAAWTWTIDATRRDRLLPLAVFLSVSRTRDGAFSGLFRPFVSRDLSQI